MAAREAAVRMNKTATPACKRRMESLIQPLVDSHRTKTVYIGRLERPEFSCTNLQLRGARAV